MMEMPAPLISLTIGSGICASASTSKLSSFHSPDGREPTLYDFDRVDRFRLHALTLFLDTDHLNADGAKEFSTRLAAVLKLRLIAGR